MLEEEWDIIAAAVERARREGLIGTRIHKATLDEFLRLPERGGFLIEGLNKYGPHPTNRDADAFGRRYPMNIECMSKGKF